MVLVVVRVDLTEQDVALRSQVVVHPLADELLAVLDERDDHAGLLRQTHTVRVLLVNLRLLLEGIDRVAALGLVVGIQLPATLQSANLDDSHGIKLRRQRGG